MEKRENEGLKTLSTSSNGQMNHLNKMNHDP